MPQELGPTGMLHHPMGSVLGALRAGTSRIALSSDLGIRKTSVVF